MQDALNTLWNDYMTARSALRMEWVRGEITREQYRTTAEAFFAFANAKEDLIMRGVL
jgi:hypothetical protein